MKFNGVEIELLGHASVKIFAEGKVVYIDPWKLSSEAEKADLVLVTHEHYDHCSPEDVEKVSGKETVVIAPADCAGKLRGNVKSLLPGEKTTEQGIEIEAVPAYNPTKQFHPKANNWVGYIISIGGKRIYHAGDTDLIPEMKEVKADIVLLPVGGTYTMNAEEAAEAANLIAPETAIPIHYGDIVGSKADAEKFKEKCKCKVEIL